MTTLSREELLKRKIEVLKGIESSTDDYEAELVKLTRLYPHVEDLPDFEWIIDGVLAKHGITVIGGLTDAGKTTLTLQICDCLLEGKPFLEMAVGVQVNSIAYACLDESTAMLKQQIGKMTPAFPSLQRIRVIPDILWDGREVRGLTEAIEVLQPQVVVIDALNALLGTVDENVAVGPITRQFRRITESGVSLIILHQFRKPSNSPGFSEPTAQDFRGSSEIGAKPEVMLAMQRKGFEVKLIAVKAKSANKVYLNLRQDPISLVYSLCISKLERIRQLLKEGMEPNGVIAIIYKEYGGNANSIKTQVYRERKEIGGTSNNL